MIGIFSKTTDSSIIEAAGISGLDFVIIDQEHGPASRENLYNHIRAAKATNMKSIVRVAQLNHNLIGSAYDAGADGVQVPNISNESEARLAVEAARFYPIGNRGVCRFVKSAEFGEKNRDKYFIDENNKILILQVEGVEGIKNLEKILQVEGFDVLFIGPYDLSQSIGLPGQIDNPIVRELIKNVTLISNKFNKRLGTFTDNIDSYRVMKELGFEYIAYSVDINIFVEACKKIKENE
jgi:4-hydroxy-2-oxoheptanedioate aldolase